MPILPPEPGGDGSSVAHSVENPRIRAAELAAEMTSPMPGSEKVYVEGSRPDIRVPMRKISQADTPSMFGATENPDFYVYDTSGPYTDANAEIDVTRGIACIREPWIKEREDYEELGALSSEYGQKRQLDDALAPLRFDHLRTPKRALPVKRW